MIELPLYKRLWPRRHVDEKADSPSVNLSYPHVLWRKILKNILTSVSILWLFLSTLLFCARGFAAPAAQGIAAIGQKAELTASNGQQGSLVGTSVAISGNTVAVGAPGTVDFGHNIPGVVYVYVKPANGWGNMIEIARLTPSDSAAAYSFGYFLAISGNTIVVNSNVGAHVFVEPVGGWVDMTETAILTDSSGPCACGQAAIEGNKIAVGSSLNRGQFSGSVQVFVKPAAGWQTTSKPNAELKQPRGTTAAQASEAVAISGSNIAAVGNVCGQAKCEDYVFLYSKPSVGWRGTITPTATLSTTNASLRLDTGTVSISGNTVVASAVGTSDNKIPGYAYVWVEPAGGWTNMTETAHLTDNSTFYDEFGFSTVILGNTILVGTPSAIEVQTGFFRGAVDVYVKPAAGWQTTSAPSAQLLNSDWTQDDGFGTSVAASSGTAVVGEPFGPVSENVGAAYVFQSF
jgi:hypothetical protein